MTKNPFINALAAAVYIAVIVTAIFYAPRSFDQTPSVATPIAMLSLFTLSTGFMGYCFLYRPLRLYLDGDKKQGAALFVKTLAVFAGITIIFLAVALFAASH